MKSYFTVFCFLLLFVAATFTFSIAQTNWTKYGTAVLDPGVSGEWDDSYTISSCVIFEDTLYRMWYSGDDGEITCIGYATSEDGINWTKYEANPVLCGGDSASWDDSSVYHPYVLLVDSVYHMWFAGEDGSTTRIGLATSTDGISWTKYEANPVMDIGPEGSWKETSVSQPSVRFDGNNYHMYFSGWASALRSSIGYATSTDGITWIEDAANPVLEAGMSGWDDVQVSFPDVIFDGSMYHMWYTGQNTPNWFYWRIGYATSPDGIDWTKYDQNPVLTASPGSWDGQGVGFQRVILDEATSTFKMYYTGGAADWDGHIGYATAPLNLHVPDNFATIQQAIDAAHDGNVVLVADGTYYENINFKGKAITVASHFYLDGDTSHISNTIIDGSQSANPDSGSVVYFVSGEDTNSVLSGFTITGGSGTSLQLFPHWSLGKAGGGIHIIFSGAKIENNHIINNNIFANGDSVANGSAIVAFGDTGDYLVIRDNLIRNNTSTTPTFVFGTVTWGMKETTVFERNTVTANISTADIVFGGGLYMMGQEDWQGDYIVRNNLIKDNILNGTSIGRGGGINFENCSPEISNNIISGNEAIIGGGIAVNHWDEESGIHKPLFINNTIFNNSASTTGGGIRIRGQALNEVKVLNTILWGNSAPTGPQISVANGSGSITIHYSDVQGGWPGEGNIDADPQFEDSLLFNLSMTSPCVGAGAVSDSLDLVFVEAPATDIDGDPRPWGETGVLVDIGANESHYLVSSIKRLNETKPRGFTLFQNYPNPFNNSTMISYQLAVNSKVVLSIFNLLGQKVTTLVSQKQPAGKYEVQWDANGFASGVYVYKLTADNGYESAKKLILLK